MEVNFRDLSRSIVYFSSECNIHFVLFTLGVILSSLTLFLFKRIL